MGVAIVGHWDPPDVIAGIPPAAKKLPLHWATTAKAFGVHQIHMVGKNIPAFGDQEIDFRSFLTLDEALAEFEGLGRVYVERDGIEHLVDYVHPTGDCVYVFGGDYGGLQVPENHDSVKVIEGDIPLYAHVAMAIVLFDRTMKR